MKVIETVSKGEWGNDGRIEIQVVTDTFIGSVEFGEGEPEDMTLNRDLSDAYNIASLISAAYEAGKKGEIYESVYIDEEEEE